MAGTALLVLGPIPVALINSEGAGSVWIVVQLPGAHLFNQVLGNLRAHTAALWWSRHITTPADGKWRETLKSLKRKMVCFKVFKQLFPARFAENSGSFGRTGRSPDVHALVHWHGTGFGAQGW